MAYTMTRLWLQAMFVRRHNRLLPRWLLPEQGFTNNERADAVL